MIRQAMIIFSSAILLTAIGCGGMQRSAGGRDQATDYQASRANSTQRDPAVVQGEERVIDAANWRQVQRLLGQKGYNPGAVNGQVTDQTREAVRSYQRNNRFNVTGLLDSQTLIAMERDGAGFTGTLGQQLERADGDPTLGED